MTPVAQSETVAATRPAGGLMAVLRPLVSPRTWQATFHVGAGMFLGVASGGVLWFMILLWAAAISSLAEGPTGHPLLPVLYTLVAVAGPLALLSCARFFGVLQRERFRALLGVKISAPRPGPGTGWKRAARSWTATSAWRQLAYCLAAPLAGGLAGAFLLLCWSALPLAVLWSARVPMSWSIPWFCGAVLLVVAAPWVARYAAAADTAVARSLLGPDRAERLTERVESLTRSRTELVDAADAERRRIERDLHDGVQQRLVSLAMNLGMARLAFDDQAPEVREVIGAAHDEATAALTELRDFVRGLHPAVLTNRGLDAALSGVAARIPLPVRLTVDVEPRCSASIEAIAYFTVSEALTNAVKHAQASRADVVVKRVDDRLIIAVTDDGRGGAAAGGAGTGLRGLAQRAAAVDGSLTVTSPPGGPTAVTVDIPCE